MKVSINNNNFVLIHVKNIKMTHKKGYISLRVFDFIMTRIDLACINFVEMILVKKKFDIK